jgi:multisubunit Na+/H+ antiporter MnhB subunit
MEKKTILVILSFLIFFIIYLIIWTVLKLSFENLSEPIRAMISGGLTVVFSPRVMNYNTQSGDKFQLNWIILKKSINL